MEHLLIVLAVCLCIANTMNTQKQKYLDDQSNTLGYSIQSLIQLATASGQNNDQINLLLQNIAQNIQNQKIMALKVKQSDQSICEKLINDMESSVTSHQMHIDSFSKLIVDSTGTLNQDKLDIVQVNKDIEENSLTHNNEAILRSEQLIIFESKDKENDGNIVAIDEATKILYNLQEGVAFIQIKNRFEKVLTQLSLSKQPLFKPLVASMTQLAIKVDNQYIKKIQELLNQIRQQISASKQNLMQTESGQAENWVIYNTHLLEEKKRLSDILTTLEGSIQYNQAIIESSKFTIEDHKFFLEDEREALDIQNDWCGIQASNYEEENGERDEQILTIERLQEALIQNEESFWNKTGF